MGFFVSFFFFTASEDGSTKSPLRTRLCVENKRVWFAVKIDVHVFSTTAERWLSNHRGSIGSVMVAVILSLS